MFPLPTPPNLHTHPLPGLVVRVCAALFLPVRFLLVFIGASCLCCQVVFSSFFLSYFLLACNRVNCFRFDDEAIDCVSFYGLHFGWVWFALNLHSVLGGKRCWCCFYGVDIGNIRFGSGKGKSFKEACLTWANKLVSACHSF